MQEKPLHPQTRQHFIKQVLNWYELYGRKNLPWQKHATPYVVWVSEIMLQQTQVTTVIDYFQRFMQAFPIIQDLAAAPLEQVLHLWSGLGYYARARNLHRTAQIIASEHKGQFPQTVKALTALPGIGRSTAGAIIALGYHQPASILDGNVKRVLSRYFGIHGDPNSTPTNNCLWTITDALTPHTNIAAYTQAMMDLGAIICTRTQPQCHSCPLAACYAKKTTTQQKFPYKKKKIDKPIKNFYVFIVRYKQFVLLEQRPMQGIWAGLYAFLQCETDTDPNTYYAQHCHWPIQYHRQLPKLRHSFTHYHCDIIPIEIQVACTRKPKVNAPYLWYNLNKPPAVGLAAIVGKILKGGLHVKNRTLQEIK